jgi:hypothetical protein
LTFFFTFFENLAVIFPLALSYFLLTSFDVLFQGCFLHSCRARCLIHHPNQNSVTWTLFVRISVLLHSISLSTIPPSFITFFFPGLFVLQSCFYFSGDSFQCFKLIFGNHSLFSHMIYC